MHCDKKKKKIEGLQDLQNLKLQDQIKWTGAHKFTSKWSSERRETHYHSSLSVYGIVWGCFANMV